MHALAANSLLHLWSAAFCKTHTYIRSMLLLLSGTWGKDRVPPSPLLLGYSLYCSCAGYKHASGCLFVTTKPCEGGREGTVQAVLKCPNKSIMLFAGCILWSGLRSLAHNEAKGKRGTATLAAVIPTAPLTMTLLLLCRMHTPVRLRSSA